MIRNFTGLFSFLLLTAFVYTSSLSCKKSDSAPPNPPSTPPPPPPANPDTTKLHGWIVFSIAGNGTSGNADGDSTNARLAHPSDITQDVNGNLYVVDAVNKNIRMITPAGKVTTPYKENLAAGDTLKDCVTLTNDGYGTIYTIRNTHIHKLTANGCTLFAGNYASVYKDGQDSSAGFREIMNVTKDSHGNIYIPDYDAQKNLIIRKVTPSAQVSTLLLFDYTGYHFLQDGNYSSIAIDSAGNIFFTGMGSNMIKKADPQGNVSVLAGSAVAGFKDGKGTQAQFNYIIGLAADASGNLWVSDTKNNAIRKVSADGTVTTIAGNGTAGYANGDSATARFHYPEAIAVGKNGSVYVVDGTNSTIRKIVYYP